MDFAVRLYEPPDRQACLAIAAEVFEDINIPYLLERDYGLPGLGSRMNVVWTDGLCASTPQHLLVAHDHGQVLGFAGLAVDQDFGIGAVLHVGVARSAQCRGVGRAMMDAALEHFRAHRLAVAWVDYDAQNDRAGRLYRRCGYEPFARLVVFSGAVGACQAGDALPLAGAAAIEGAADRLTAGRALCVEQALAERYALGIDPRLALRRGVQGLLRDGLVAGWQSSAGDALVLAALWADEPVRRLVVLHSGDDPSSLAAALNSALRRCMSGVGTAPEAQVACVEVFDPPPATLQGLQAAGLRQVHSLEYLGRCVCGA